MRINLLLHPFIILALLASTTIGVCATRANLVTEGRYLYSSPVSQESPALQTGRDEAPVDFEEGRVTDGDPTKPVYWRGEKDKPTTMYLVFDLLADQRLEKVVLHTRHINEYHSNHNISVETRAESDDSYSVALASRDGLSNPWEQIEIDMGDAPVRFVRVTFNRRHPYVNTPISEVEFFTTRTVARSSRSAEMANLAAEFDLDVRLVDRFGQFLYEDWDGKIESERDLQKDLRAEKRKLSGVERDADRFDTYGGFKSQALDLKATGFFRLEKVDGRWWFVTPEGNVWFMNGIDAVSPWEWGNATALTDGKTGEIRGVFAELPDRDKFRDAYIDHGDRERLNFVVANLRAKYGRDYEVKWAELMKKRLLDWGFNANAKWTRDPRVGLPYISVLKPSDDTRRIKYAADPFDPDFARNIEQGIRDDIDRMRDDPLLIGHTFESESGWDMDIFREMLRMDEESPAKAAFLEFMKKRYPAKDALAEALGLSPEAFSLESALAEPIELTDSMDADARAFILEASKRYYRISTRIIREMDPNHLLLGSSLTPGWRSSYEWEIGATEFMDALSFDYYVTRPSWIKPYLKFDIPILILEYSYTVNGRGMPSFHASTPTYRDRGIYYRHFIENLAAQPQFVGAGWFLLYDQPVTGRSNNGGGERYNFGLLNQQDQPYDDTLEEMKKTAARLYDVHSGKVDPFQRPDVETEDD